MLVSPERPLQSNAFGRDLVQLSNGFAGSRGYQNHVSVRDSARPAVFGFLPGLELRFAGA
jgi:hypothetical protein